MFAFLDLRALISSWGNHVRPSDVSPSLGSHVRLLDLCVLNSIDGNRGVPILCRRRRRRADAADAADAADVADAADAADAADVADAADAAEAADAVKEVNTDALGSSRL